jgi:site-specific DNA recombinase
MNCLLYSRVSTDRQADKELPIPAQLQAMQQYASDRGWVILEEFVEAGVSARTADRPGLRQLLQRCRDKEQTKVEVLLVHKLDRLARNLADHVAIRAQLRESTVTLASVTETVEDSVSGQLVEHILAAMAEFYSANLSEEVKKGMRQKVLQGGWPHRPPRDYRIVLDGLRSTFVIDEIVEPLIRKAFELCRFGYPPMSKTGGSYDRQTARSHPLLPDVFAHFRCGPSPGRRQLDAHACRKDQRGNG